MTPAASAALVVAGGMAAALHVGKLPPAVPVLQQALGIGLMEAGFLLSLVQLAGMTLGLVAGSLATALGLKRTMVAGLLVLSGASMAGGEAREPATLLALRAVEGVGFLLAVLPAPALLRRSVAGPALNAALGWWGAYMPVGTALALLGAPACLAFAGWTAWWRLVGAASLLMAGALWWLLPADPPRAGEPATGQGWWARVAPTLKAPGPWIAALAFAVYSSQWLAVIGFLPTIYDRAGLSPGLAAAATALAAAVNALGNVVAGRLLARGWRAPTLLRIGYGAMTVGAIIAFSGEGAAFASRFAGVLVFSCVGGLIPGTLFSLAVRFAPGERAVSSSVGWVQQWSSLGQFVGPPVVAWAALRLGGWHALWWTSAACAAAGWVLAAHAGRLLRPAAGSNPAPGLESQPERESRR